MVVGIRVTNVDYVLFQLAGVKVRQRKILEILRQNKLTDWDGNLADFQAEIDSAYEELARALNEDLNKSGQVGDASNRVAES